MCALESAGKKFLKLNFEERMTNKVEILGLFVVTGFIQVDKVVRKISSYGNSRLFMKYWLSPLRCGVPQETEPSRSTLFLILL